MNKELSEMYRAVYLTAEDLRSVASLIYNAYHDDPLFRQALYKENHSQYEKKLRGTIREELTELWHQDQTFVGLYEKDRLVGVICINTQPDSMGEGRYWNWRIRMLMSIGLDSTRFLMAKEKGMLEHLPASNCGIIQFICVSPLVQKKGLSHLLLNAITLWCDEEGELDGLAVFVYQNFHTKLFKEHDFVSVSNIEIGGIEGEIMFYATQRQ